MNGVVRKLGVAGGLLYLVNVVLAYLAYRRRRRRLNEAFKAQVEAMR